MHFFILPVHLSEDLEKALQILSAQYPLYIVSNSQCGYIELFLAKNPDSPNISMDISVMEIPVLIKVQHPPGADQNGLKDPVYVR